MVEGWPKPASDSRVIFGTVLIVAGFVFLIIFTSVFAPMNRLTAWEGAMLACVLLFAGFAVGFSVKIKTVVGAILVVIVGSFGFVIIPVPEGQADVVLGSYLLLLLGLIIAYEKYTHRKKKV
jgi:hypothetical protein